MNSVSRDIDVTCLGVLVADALAKPITRIPDWRQLELVDQVELQVGGCASNTGTGVAGLGLKAAVIGKVGNDGFGDFIVKHLKGKGIDTTGLSADPGIGTSFTFVMIAPDGERAFFHYVGANGKLSTADVDFSLIARSRILHVAGSFIMPGIDGEPTAGILKKANETGVTTCLDTVWNGDIDAWATIKPSLPYLDYFVPSIDEARLMVKKEAPEDIAAALIDEGVGTVCLKMGAEGVYIRSRDEKLLIPAFRTEVADTSGVGDSWIAGFLAGLCKDWSVEESARLGAAMGALCVQAIGTTAGLRNLEETLEFMNTADTLE